MSRRGEIFTNPVTGERAVVRRGTEDGPGGLIADLHIQPGGRVAGAHVHPKLTERFTVRSGTVGFSVDGEEREGGPGTAVTVAAGVLHDWWNAGADEAHVVVEIDGPASVVRRFEQSIMLLFGLAHERKVDESGMPDLLQLAVLAVEYRDVIRFATPPEFVQRTALPLLALLGRARGRRASYPQHRALVVSRA